MRRRSEQPANQPEQQYVERGAGASGSGGMQSSSAGTTSYGQGTAPGQRADYGTSGTSGYYRPTPSRHGSGLSILAGSLAFLEGLAFIIRSHYYHALPGYAYRWNLHGWGWVLLILGALLFAAGVSHLLGLKGSRHLAAAIAVITAVVAFVTIFYSVVWGILVLATSGFAAHALLSHHGMEERYGGGSGSGGYGGGRGGSYQQEGYRQQGYQGQGYQGQGYQGEQTAMGPGEQRSRRPI